VERVLEAGESAASYRMVVAFAPALQSLSVIAAKAFAIPPDEAANSR
jgi:hypothetical protein